MPFREFTNRVQLPSGTGYDELAMHSQFKPPHPVMPLSREKKFTTRALRVGGGYLLQEIEKPIIEDKENIAMLSALIKIQLENKNQLLMRINEMIKKNIELHQKVESIDSTAFENILLNHQKNLKTYQDLQVEANELDTVLKKKSDNLLLFQEKSAETITKMSSSLVGITQLLSTKNDRIFNLKNYEALKKHQLMIKAQQLIDHLKEIKNANAESLSIHKAEYEAVLRRQAAFHEKQISTLLESAVDKAVDLTPDRLKKELYLNSQMRLEKKYCHSEVAKLKQEIKELESKISNFPKKKFTDRQYAYDESSVTEDTEILFDFPRRLNLPI